MSIGAPSCNRKAAELNTEYRFWTRVLLEATESKGWPEMSSLYLTCFQVGSHLIFTPAWFKPLVQCSGASFLPCACCRLPNTTWLMGLSLFLPIASPWQMHPCWPSLRAAHYAPHLSSCISPARPAHPRVLRNMGRQKSLSQDKPHVGYISTVAHHCPCSQHVQEHFFRMAAQSSRWHIAA